MSRTISKSKGEVDSLRCFVKKESCGPLCERKVGGWQVRKLRGHSGDVLTVAFSPDGSSIVSGAADNLVKIWDAATGAEVSSHRGCTL